MSDLGWRAQSSQLARQAKPIEGLRNDFGVRVRAAVEAMKDEKSSNLSRGPSGEPVQTKGRLQLTDEGKKLPRKATEGLPQTANQGVEARAAKDLIFLQSEDDKERRRLEALERKAALYERLQRRVDLDNEAANDQHEVDFIAKALNQPDPPGQGPCAADPSPQQLPGPPQPTLHPEEIVRRQQMAKEQMQGGRHAAYSTYDEDVAELEARHQKVDELDAMNAERNAEIEDARKRKAARQEAKDRDLAKHKSALLQQLMKKRRKLNPKSLETG